MACSLKHHWDQPSGTRPGVALENHRMWDEVMLPLSPPPSTSPFHSPLPLLPFTLPFHSSLPEDYQFKIKKEVISYSHLLFSEAETFQLGQEQLPRETWNGPRKMYSQHKGPGGGSSLFSPQKMRGIMEKAGDFWFSNPWVPFCL